MKIDVEYTARLHGLLTVEVPDGLTGEVLDDAIEKAAYDILDTDLYQIGTVGISNYYTEEEDLDYECP